MAKDKLTDYSATNASNTDVGGVNIDEGMLPSAVNNALRELLTHLKEFSDGTSGIDVLSLADDDASAAMKLQAPASVTSDTTLTLPDGDGADGQALITNGSGTLAWAYPYGNRNLIINGAMQVAQRGTSAVTINSGSAQYLLDRFYASGQSSAGVFTVEQSTDTPANFKNSLKVTVTTADSSIGSTANYRLQQSLEGQNISHLNYGSSDAQTITLSFYVKSSLTGTFGGRLSNSALDRSYPFTYTISSANTWERKTVTIAGDTSGTWLDTNGVGIALVWSIGAGSSRLGTAGAWAGTRYDGASGQTNIIATNSATFFITGIQLEVGEQATPFEHRSYGEQLQLCRRYFTRYTGNTVFAVGQAISTSQATASVPLQQPMRVAPTKSQQGIKMRNSTGNSATASALSISNKTEDFIELLGTRTGSGLTAGDACQFRVDTTSDFLDFDAEL